MPDEFLIYVDAANINNPHDPAVPVHIFFDNPDLLAENKAGRHLLCPVPEVLVRFRAVYSVEADFVLGAGLEYRDGITISYGHYFADDIGLDNGDKEKDKRYEMKVCLKGIIADSFQIGILLFGKALIASAHKFYYESFEGWVSFASSGSDTQTLSLLRKREQSPI